MHHTKHGLRRSRVAAVAAFGALLSLAVVLAACGGDDSTKEAASGNSYDRAFIAEMVPHHESAVDMAKIALERGQSSYVKELADDIVSAQNAEIKTMQLTDKDIEEAGVETGDMGMSGSMPGMEMSDEMKSLETATPFDRAFIDAMIPHHQGAIHMARMEKEMGKSPAMKKLAGDIVSAQAAEIEEMNAFRKRTYGAPSPAGGVPTQQESADMMDDSGSGGHDMGDM